MLPNDTTGCSFTPVILHVSFISILSKLSIKFSFIMEISAPVSNNKVSGLKVRLVFNSI